MFPPKGQFVCGQQWSFTKHYKCLLVNERLRQELIIDLLTPTFLCGLLAMYRSSNPQEKNNPRFLNIFVGRSPYFCSIRFIRR